MLDNIVTNKLSNVSIIKFLLAMFIFIFIVNLVKYITRKIKDENLLEFNEIRYPIKDISAARRAIKSLNIRDNGFIMKFYIEPNVLLVE